MSDIELSVGLDTDDVQDKSEELRQQIENIFNNADDSKTSAAFKSLQQQMDKAYQKSVNIQQQMLQLENTPVQTDTYIKLEKELDKLEKRYITLQDRKDKFLATTKSKNPEETSTYKSIEYDMEQTAARIRDIKSEMEAEAELTVSGADTPKYDQLVQQLSQVNNQMTIYIQKAQAMGASTQGTQHQVLSFGQALTEWMKACLRAIGYIGKALLSIPIHILGRVASALKDAAVNAAKFVASIPVRAVKAIGSAVASLAKNLVKIAGNSIRRGITNLGKSIGNLGKSIGGLGKHTKSTNNGLQIGFKNFLRYGLGVRSLFALINKLRRALGDGFSAMGKAYEPFGTALNNFTNATKTFRNSAAAMFAPLLQQALPILTTFINALSEATAKVGQFFAALQGKSIFIKAEKVQTSYASSLDKTAEKAKKLKLQLLGFDDIQRLEGDDDDSSASGGGGGDADMEGNFMEVPIAEKIKEIANKIREYVKQENWEGLGRYLGEGVNSVFTKANKMLNAQPLYDKISYWTTAIAGVINGFVDQVDWALIGDTVASGINLIVFALNSLYEKIDWENIGTSIGTGLNGLINGIDWQMLGTMLGNKVNAWISVIHGIVNSFDFAGAATNLATGLNSLVSTIDWAKMGQTFSGAITGALTFFATAIEEFDWYQLGKDIEKFLENVDWDAIADKFFELLGAAIGGAFALIWGVVEDTVLEIRDKFKENIEKYIDIYGEDNLGAAIIAGILDGILRALVDIATWIYDHIFKPFVEGFEKAFEIHSPSKVMEKEGGFIIDGLKNGLTSSIKWFPILSAMSNKASEIKQKFEGISWSSVGSNIVSGIQAGMRDGMDWLTRTASTLATAAYDTACWALGIHSPSKLFREGVGEMIPEGIALGITDAAGSALGAVKSLSAGLFDGAVDSIQLPPIVSGGVVPYSAGSSSTNDIQATLARLSDMMEYTQSSAVTRDELEDIITDIAQRYFNIDLYIGDEQIARHANSGNARLNRRYKAVKAATANG